MKKSYSMVKFFLKYVKYKFYIIFLIPQIYNLSHIEQMSLQQNCFMRLPDLQHSTINGLSKLELITASVIHINLMIGKLHTR